VYNLGPHSVAGRNLYEFRPRRPPAEAGAATYWPTTDWFGDIYAGFLRSQLLADGLYQIKLEVYDARGRLVAPGPGTFRFIVPDSVRPDGTVETELATTLDGAGVVFNLHLDNRACGAEVLPPLLAGRTLAGPCGFLEYASKTQEVRIAFYATHPANFATFGFHIVRGTTVVSSLSEDVDASGADGYTGDGTGHFYDNPTVADLLGPCPNRAAFSARVYTYAKATNGWHHRLSALDASHVRAFALAPELLR
jgi:hypothetical protein